MTSNEWKMIKYLLRWEKPRARPTLGKKATFSICEKLINCKVPRSIY
jgi:hypothetical protein